MTTNSNDEIRTAPVDLYDRLQAVSDAMTEMRRELADIGREYDTLSRHPDQLDIDTLGDPTVTPEYAADAVSCDLNRVKSELASAQSWLVDTRGRYASRLKLTDRAADELDQRTRAAEATRHEVAGMEWPSTPTR